MSHGSSFALHASEWMLISTHPSWDRVLIVERNAGSMEYRNSVQGASGLRDKKAYDPPTLVELGSVENRTQWIGGLFGEFFGGQGTGWNPWSVPPSNTGS